jgi:eukaryotic-like serine/threonine-protein kinase
MEYRFGPFRVEPLERRLMRDDAALPLTPKAFDLLVALVENHGRLLEKDALMKRVWPEAFVEEANLANNISLLRKVLAEGNGEVQYIETVPRRGYRFLADVTEHPPGDSTSSVPAAAPAPMTAGPPLSRRVFRIAIISVLVTVSVALAVAVVRPRLEPHAPKVGPVVRFAVIPPDGTLLPPRGQPVSPALSPDGTYLVFRVLRDGAAILAIRAIADVDSRILPGTEGATFPFWSPDGRAIGFFADGKLKRIDRSGGPARILSDAALGAGGTWNRDSEILFAPTMEGPLFKIAATGGQPSPVAALHTGEASHQHPQFLPDGRSYIYFSPPDGIYLGSLAGNASVRVLTSRSQARYALPGYLLFVKDQTLLAQRFDVDRARVTGAPMPLADGVPIGGGGAAGDGRPAGGGAFSVSESGLLTYRTVAPVRTKLAWFDRAGRVAAPVALPAFERFSDVELSPDGMRIAFAHGTRPFAEDVWVVDLATGQANQQTFDPASDRRPIWSGNGEWLVFASERPEARGLYRKMWKGDKPEELLLRNDVGQPEWPSDWATTGIVYERPQSVASAEARLLPLDGDRKPHRLVQSPVSQPDAKMSPDAKWIAYTGGEPGERPDVFVQSTFTPSAPQRISTSGGTFPRWRRDGRELFYLAGDGSLMAVPIAPSARQLNPCVPRPLFQTSLNEIPESLRSFGVSRDGQRFLMTVSADPGATQSLVVMSNWQSALQR